MKYMFEELERDRSLKLIKFLHDWRNGMYGIVYNKYQIKIKNDYWQRNKKYLLVKLISKLKKVENN